jgi:hypothetical protein
LRLKIHKQMTLSTHCFCSDASRACKIMLLKFQNILHCCNKESDILNDASSEDDYHGLAACMAYGRHSAAMEIDACQAMVLNKERVLALEKKKDPLLKI